MTKTHVSEQNIVAILSLLDEIMATELVPLPFVGVREEGKESDRVKLTNSSSDNPPPGRDSRTKVRR